MDQRTTRLLEESNQVGIAFLLTDLKTIATLLNISDVAADEGTCQRNLLQARKGYRAILRHFPRVKPSPEERLEMEDRIAAIKLRLENAGLDAGVDAPSDSFQEPEY
jgi:hypothetical protein